MTEEINKTDSDDDIFEYRTSPRISESTRRDRIARTAKSILKTIGQTGVSVDDAQSALDVAKSNLGRSIYSFKQE